MSDVLTQVFIEKKAFDVRRLVKMASFGFLLHGTTGHFFYNFLDGLMAGATPGVVAAKVAMTTTLAASSGCVTMTIIARLIGQCPPPSDSAGFVLCTLAD